MASDMLVALARSTRDGHTYFGHNTNRPRGETPSVVRTAAHEYAPGETVVLSHASLPQARHTLTVLAGRARDEWGYQYGVNEKGVAVGCTPIRTRLDDLPGLAGPELVRLALERAATACQAVETLTDLIGRHGADAHAFLVADHEEAVVLEAGGRHWALAEVGSVRAVTGACLLRQDWDRISRGLSGVAIDRRWWPDDGRKLDFASACGAAGPDHARDLRRWGQATLALEQHSGQLDTPLLRRVLGHQAALVRQGGAAGGDEMETIASALVRLSPNSDEPPVCWYAPCSPEVSVYLPLLLDADPPAGSALALREAFLARRASEGWADLQQRLDEHLHEYLPEATALRRQGRPDEPRRLATSFMQYVVERVEEVVPVPTRDRELAEAW
jgi:secernin